MWAVGGGGGSEGEMGKWGNARVQLKHAALCRRKQGDFPRHKLYDYNRTGAKNLVMG